MPPRTRCCIRSSDCIDGAPSDSSAATLQDAQRRLVLRCGTQFGDQAFLVGVGHRQPQNAVPVAARGQRVDQWLHRIGVIADEQPRRPLADVRRGARLRDFSQRIS